jgi:hypothetical protein
MLVKNSMCSKCMFMDECKVSCPALQKLMEIYQQTRNTDRHQLIKKLQKEIGIVDAEPSKDMRRLADQILDNDAILDKYPELNIIREYNIQIGYIMSQEKPPGSKIKYADCEKVKVKHRAWLPYDFIITFYEPNTELLSDNQRKILMLHELKHIGVGERGFKLEEHDTEDFAVILERYGVRWDEIDRDVLDILLEDK